MDPLVLSLVACGVSVLSMLVAVLALRKAGKTLTSVQDSPLYISSPTKPKPEREVTQATIEKIGERPVLRRTQFRGKSRRKF